MKIAALYDIHGNLPALNALLEELKKVQPDLIVVCGHTHMQFERCIDTLRILNAGSVGMPYADQPGAYWLLLSPQGYEFRRTTYNGEAAAQAVRESGYPLVQEFTEGATAAEATEIFEHMAEEHWL